jgi:hypothetical protein
MANKIPNSTLRTDILTEELTEVPARVVVSSVYANAVENTEQPPKNTTPGISKNILEVMELIKDAIEDYESRQHKIEKDKVIVVYEDPDKLVEFETISIHIESRQPGIFQSGAPLQGQIKNQRPILREEGPDPDAPGYRRAILGYFHDNIIRVTCWALTNKAANARMLWLEEIMEQYLWYFRMSGVNRFLYHKHAPQLVKMVSNNRIYGRPIDYFVRTETIRAISEKELETIYVSLALRKDGNLNKEI